MIRGTYTYDVATQPDAYVRPEGRDADARLAGARLPGVHGAEPPARAAARQPFVQPAGAVLAEP